MNMGLAPDCGSGTYSTIGIAEKNTFGNWFGAYGQSGGIYMTNSAAVSPATSPSTTAEYSNLEDDDSSHDLTARPTSLAEFFGWTESRSATEELVIQACMEAKGFIYNISPTREPQSAGPGMSPDEYAERFGYGTASTPESHGTIQRDPNFAYFRSLSPAGQQQYLAALQGDIAATGSAEEGSCASDGNDLANRDHELLSQAFGEELEVLDRRVTQQLDADGLFDEWQSCMAFQGFSDAVSPEQFTSEMTALIRDELEASTGQRATDRIVQREVAIATSERSCTRPLEERTNALRYERETDFILSHYTELSSIRRQHAEDVEEYLSR